MKIDKIVTKMKSQHREVLEWFFDDMKGSPRSLKNNEFELLRKAYKYVQGLVYEHNEKKPDDKIKSAQIFSKLGFVDEILTNPSNRAIMQRLADMAIENLKENKDLYDGFVGSDLHTTVNRRAKKEKLPITEFMGELGYDWEGSHWYRERTFAEIEKQTGLTEGGLDFDSLSPTVQEKLSHLAFNDKDCKTVQDFLLMHTSYYLTGAPLNSISTQEDVFKIMKKRFDNNNLPIQLRAPDLRAVGLYNWTRHMRELTGFATTHSISDFINEKIDGYTYVGLNTTQNIDRTPERGTARISAPVDSLDLSK